MKNSILAVLFAIYLLPLAPALGSKAVLPAQNPTDLRWGLTQLAKDKLGLEVHQIDESVWSSPGAKKWHSALKVLRFPRPPQRLHPLPFDPPVLRIHLPDILTKAVSAPMALYVASVSSSPELEPAVIAYVKAARQLISSTAASALSIYDQAFNDLCSGAPADREILGLVRQTPELELQVAKVGAACLPIQIGLTANKKGKSGHPSIPLAIEFPTAKVTRLVRSNEPFQTESPPGTSSCDSESDGVSAPLILPHQPQENVLVAVIDSGVDYNHPALRPNLIHPNLDQLTIQTIQEEIRWRANETSNERLRASLRRFQAQPVRLKGLGWDFLKNLNLPMDFFNNQANSLGWMLGTGHGTHVAGIVVQNRFSGRNPISILPIRMIGEGKNESYENSYDAIALAELRGARVANISMEGPGERGRGFKEAILDHPQFAVAIAAGNGPVEITEYSITSQSFTAENLIRVASIDMTTGELSRESNYSKRFVDVAAPGVNIRSCVVGSKTARLSGTSMASPQVANLLATLFALKPDLTAAEAKNLICDTATKLPSLENKVRCGLINPERAIAQLLK